MKTIVMAVLAMMMMMMMVGCGSGGSSNKSYYQQKTEVFAMSSAAGKVAVVGDSITEMWRLPEGYANRGIIGDNTAGVLMRINQHIAEHPSEIILLIGTNDLGQNINQGTTISNYTQIVERVLAAGIPLKIVSLLPRKDKDVTALNLALEEIAKSHSVPYLDWYSKFDVSLTYDGLHPTPEGYAILTPLLVVE